MSHYLNSPHNAAVSIFKSPKECRVNACMGGCVDDSTENKRKKHLNTK